MEAKLAQHLMELAKSTESREIKEALDKLYPSSADLSSLISAKEDDAEIYVANPLNALGLVRRMSRTVAQIGLEEMLGNQTEREKEVKRLLSLLPSPSNYVGALSSLALLQEAYDLNITQLAQGKLASSSEKIGASEYVPIWTEICEIGVEACNRGWWDSGTEFLRVGLSLAPKNAEDLDVWREKFEMSKKYHDQMLLKRGKRSSGHRCRDEFFDPELNRKNAKKGKKKASELADKANKKKDNKKSKKNKKIDSKKEGESKTNNTKLIPLFSTNFTYPKELTSNFHNLCKSSQTSNRPASLDADLRCRYVHQNDDYLRLGPFKLEELNRLPHVALFKDFVGRKQTKYLRDLASKKLKRSAVGTVDNPKTDLMRTSKQMWLPERVFDLPLADDNSETPLVPPNVMKYLKILDPVAINVSRNIERATGLHVVKPLASESYQIANYGLGGQYGVHYNSHNFMIGGESGEHPLQHGFNRVVGDRLATMLIYLSSVAKGGTTVFPVLGLASSAAEGDALYFVNLDAKGHMDKLTHHGGCPVLIGSKWISNKWIFYNDQFKIAPCGLTTDQRVLSHDQWRSHSYN